MTKLNYIDLGLHQAREVDEFLRAMNGVGYDVTVYGFEAHPELAESCKNKYSGQKNIHIINKAVSNKNGHERLFISLMNEMEGNSIFSSKKGVDKDKFVTIESVKLSEWIVENIPNFKNDKNILRMNIEGAELFVIEDLVSSGLHKYIDVFLGSSKNDILKCSEIADRNSEYQMLLKKHKINIYPYCIVNVGRLTDTELRNLIKYGIPPWRVIKSKIKNRIKRMVSR